MMKKIKKILAANWKMNPGTLAEAKKLLSECNKLCRKLKGTDMIILPPALYLSPLAALSSDKKLSLGAQNAFFEEKGAFTGELSAAMLSDAGARYVLVGHSERRARGESDEEVSKKVAAILKNGMSAVVCVGEAHRDSHAQYLTFLKKQLLFAFAGVTKSSLNRISIAYEPVWAIGKDYRAAMSAHDLYQTSLFIRKVLSELYSKEIALQFPIIYGGSVEPANAHDLMHNAGVSGFLVGHASLQIESFSRIAYEMDRQ